MKQKQDSYLETKNHYMKVLESKIFERFEMEASVSFK